MISLSFSLALNDSFSNIYFVFITLLFSFKNQQIIFTFYCPLNFTFCFSFFKNRVIQFPNKQVIPFAQKESLWNLFRFPLPRYQIDLKKKNYTHEQKTGKDSARIRRFFFYLLRTRFALFPPKIYNQYFSWTKVQNMKNSRLCYVSKSNWIISFPFTFHTTFL